MKKIYLLLISLCILNTLDYFSTIQALTNGAVEANPIAQFFISKDALHYLKIIGLAYLVIYLGVRAKRSVASRPRITKVLIGANIAYLVIVVSNFIVALM